MSSAVLTNRPVLPLYVKPDGMVPILQRRKLLEGLQRRAREGKQLSPGHTAGKLKSQGASPQQAACKAHTLLDRPAVYGPFVPRVQGWVGRLMASSSRLLEKLLHSTHRPRLRLQDCALWRGSRAGRVIPTAAPGAWPSVRFTVSNNC